MLRSGDDAINVRRTLKYFRGDAGCSEGLGDLDHFRHPAMGLGRQYRKLAQPPGVKIGLRPPRASGPVERVVHSMTRRSVNHNAHTSTNQRTGHRMAGRDANAGTDKSARDSRAPRQGRDGRDNDKQSHSSSHRFIFPLSVLRFKRSVRFHFNFAATSR